MKVNDQINTMATAPTKKAASKLETALHFVNYSYLLNHQLHGVHHSINLGFNKVNSFIQATSL